MTTLAKSVRALFLAMLFGLGTLGLVACDDQGPFEEAGEEIDEAGDDIQDEFEDARDDLD